MHKIAFKLSRFFSSKQKLNSSDCIKLEADYGCHNYHPLPVVIEKAQGIHATDCQGKKYLDFLSAYSAVNQGHCHPKILKTFIEQAQTLSLTSRAVHNNQLGLAQKKLC